MSTTHDPANRTRTIWAALTGRLEASELAELPVTWQAEIVAVTWALNLDKVFVGADGRLKLSLGESVTRVIDVTDGRVGNICRALRDMGVYSQVRGKHHVYRVTIPDGIRGLASDVEGTLRGGAPANQLATTAAPVNQLPAIGGALSGEVHTPLGKRMGDLLAQRAADAAIAQRMVEDDSEQALRVARIIIDTEREAADEAGEE